MTHDDQDESTTPSLGAEVREGIVDGVLGMVWTGLLFVGIGLAWLVPAVGLVVGGLLLWRAISAGNSKMVPIAIICFAVVAWFLMKEPFGLLPALLDLAA